MNNKRILALVLSMIFVFSTFNAGFALEGDFPGRQEAEFDELGIREGVQIEPQGGRLFKSQASGSKNWITLPGKQDVQLNKDWTIVFNDTFSIDQIDGMVIERNNAFIPVRVRTYPEEMQAVVTPIESYIPDEEYVLRVFLNNGDRYKMEFNTLAEEYGSEADGNTSSNFANGGLITENDGWIYYANPSDENKLYKMSIDGTDITKLYHSPAGYIAASGGWVYFTETDDIDGDVRRIRTDGTDEERIVEGISVSYINTADNNWIYYCKYNNGDMKIYRVRPNSSEEGYVASGICPHISDGWIYYQDEEMNSIMKMKMDGRDKQTLSDVRAAKLQVVGDWIYYIDLDEEKVYKMDKNGEKIIRVNDVDTEELHVSEDGWAYYVNQKDRSMYRIRTDGTDIQEITDSPAVNIHIVADWIYYKDPVEEEWYKMQTDGTDVQEWNN